ncbi:BMA-UNC-57, isoform d [Aphelenchoides bicaudatus]|nr:BMA-UNC-57, isoform d [Aphelenchoides bicaudatus]
MEKKIDLTYELVTALTSGTNEYLQPNPATRAKMATMGALSKVRGTTKSQSYPQTEGLLADTMSKYGRGLGDDSDLGKALVDASEAFRQMADIKYQLEDVVKHNFLDPITHLQNNELKDVNAHRTKLKGRRLDYDCKKRKQTRDDELLQAEEKLEESKKITEQAMFNVLSNDVEQISQLKALIDAQVDFHQQTLNVLENLKGQLNNRMKECTNRPRREHFVKPVLTDRTPRDRSPVGSMVSGTHNLNFNDNASVNSAPPPYALNGHSNDFGNASSFNAAPIPTKQKASCKALYDFEAQNPGELEFKEEFVFGKSIGIKMPPKTPKPYINSALGLDKTNFAQLKDIGAFLDFISKQSKKGDKESNDEKKEKPKKDVFFGLNEAVKKFKKGELGAIVLDETMLQPSVAEHFFGLLGKTQTACPFFVVKQLSEKAAKRIGIKRITAVGIRKDHPFLETIVDDKLEKESLAGSQTSFKKPTFTVPMGKKNKQKKKIVKKVKKQLKKVKISK